MLVAALVLLLLFASCRVSSGADGACKTSGEDEQGASLKVERSLTEDESILISAADKGDAEAISRLLSTRGKRVNVDVKDPNEGHTPLALAAAKGHIEAMRVLLGKGAALEAKSDDGQKTALLLATYWDRTEAVAYLLSRGAAVNAVNDRGDSSLHIAAYRGLLRVCSLLLQAGAVGGATTTKHGYTPLMLAAYKGFPDVVALLLDSGVDHTPIDAAGNSAAMLAAMQGHTDCALLLLEHARSISSAALLESLESRDLLGNTLFMLAANSGHGPLLDEVTSRYRPDIDTRNHKGQTPLMRAAMKGHSKVVQWLLLSGADPLPLDAQGVSAREQAAAAGGAADIVAMLQEAERYAGRVEL